MSWRESSNLNDQVLTSINSIMIRITYQYLHNEIMKYTEATCKI